MVTPSSQTTRPPLPLALLDASIEKDLKIQQALGLVEDAARVASSIVYGHYATGPEERVFRKTLERAAIEYFRAKSNVNTASNYIKPTTADALKDAIKAMTIATENPADPVTGDALKGALKDAVKAMTIAIENPAEPVTGE